MTDKTTRWAFTAYEAEWPLFNTIPEIVAEWGWQPEVCPTTQRKHYQGYIRTKRQVRFSQLRAVLPGVHLEVAKNWEALLQYCRKANTKAGASVHQHNASKAMTMADALTRLAAHVPSEYTFAKPYDEDTDTRRYWAAVNEILEIDPNAVGLYTQPQYMRAWQNTKSIWLDRAALLAEIDLDRQTDETLTEYAFDPPRRFWPKKLSRENINAPPQDGTQEPSPPCPGTPHA